MSLMRVYSICLVVIVCFMSLGAGRGPYFAPDMPGDITSVPFEGPAPAYDVAPLSSLEADAAAALREGCNLVPRGTAICSEIALIDMGPRTLPLLFDVLRTPDPTIRAEAARAFLYIRPGDVALTPVLSDAICKDVPLVRLMATHALGVIATEHAEALGALCNALRDPEKAVRVCAAARLRSVKLNASGCIPELVRLLQDEDEDVRLCAADALGNAGPVAKEALPELATLFRRASDSSLPRLGYAIASIAAGFPNASSVLRDVMTSVSLSIGVSGNTSFVLADESLGELVRLADSNSPVARKNARSFLAESAVTPEQVAPLLGLLLSPDQDVRECCPWVLRKNSKVSVPALVSLLGDADVSRSAAKMLTELSEPAPEAKMPLMDRIRDASEVDARVYFSALQAVVPRDEDVALLTVDLLCDPRFRSVDIALQDGAVDSDRVRQKLISMLEAKASVSDKNAANDCAPMVRLTKALAAWGSPAIPELKKALKAKNRCIRDGATEALNEIQPASPKHIKGLLVMLGNENENVRASAVKELGKVDPANKDITNALMDVLRNATPGLHGEKSDVIWLLADRQAALEIFCNRKPVPAEIVPLLATVVAWQEVAVNAPMPGREETPPEDDMVALANVGPPLIPYLIEYLRGGQRDAKRKAVTILGLINPSTPEAISALLDALDDEEEGYSAFKVLRKLGAEDQAFPRLMEVLQGGDENQVFHALLSLETYGAKAKPAVPVILNSKPLGWESLNALAAIGPAAVEAVPRIVEVLKARNLMSPRAASALGAILASYPVTERDAPRFEYGRMIE